MWGIHAGEVGQADGLVKKHYVALDWVHASARTHITQGASYEIGPAPSLFQVKPSAEEFRAALEGKGTPPQVAKDDTVAPVAENIEEMTRDIVLKQLAQDRKGHPCLSLSPTSSA